MHLKSLEEQSVQLGSQVFSFASGETICTEYSYKYTEEEFTKLASEANFQLVKSWTDKREYFSVFLFKAC